MWKVLTDKDLGQAFLSEGTEVGAGMVGLFYTDEGARNLFTTKEIKGLDDIKNMKRIAEAAKALSGILRSSKTKTIQALLQ